jgi:hypothetical protein
MSEHVTIVMAIYGQPVMLDKQIETITGYPGSVLERLSITIVDDCGMPSVGFEKAKHLGNHCKSAKLLRIEEDIPWNQPGARNLGMELSDGWCLMIDPDMVFEADIMDRMMQAASKLSRGQVLKYGLRHYPSNSLDMSSPNTYLIHRDDFFKVGGYDEDFCGHKGWSDVQLLDVLRSCYKLEPRPDLHADFYGTDSIVDAAVTSLDRSTKHNRKIRLKKVDQARAAGGWARWVKGRAKIPRLRFNWKLVYQSP